MNVARKSIATIEAEGAACGPLFFSDCFRGQGGWETSVSEPSKLLERLRLALFAGELAQ